MHGLGASQCVDKLSPSRFCSSLYAFACIRAARVGVYCMSAHYRILLICSVKPAALPCPRQLGLHGTSLTVCMYAAADTCTLATQCQISKTISVTSRTSLIPRRRKTKATRIPKPTRVHQQLHQTTSEYHLHLLTEPQYHLSRPHPMRPEMHSQLHRRVTNPFIHSRILPLNVCALLCSCGADEEENDPRCRIYSDTIVIPKGLPVILGMLVREIIVHSPKPEDRLEFIRE